jgi:hypothetical protein
VDRLDRLDLKMWGQIGLPTQFSLVLLVGILLETKRSKRSKRSRRFEEVSRKTQ